MYRYHRYQRRRPAQYASQETDDPVAGIFTGLFVLYLLWLSVLYFTNRTEFWEALVVGCLKVVAVVFAVRFIRDAVARRRKESLEKLLRTMRERALKESFRTSSRVSGMRRGSRVLSIRGMLSPQPVFAICTSSRGQGSSM